MAQVIGINPHCNSKSNDSERISYDVLSAGLQPDSDFVLFVEPKIRGLKPDFVLYANRLGLFIFEVKGWRGESILSATPDSVFLTRGRVKPNPARQMDEYLYALKEILQQQSLRHLPINCITLLPYVSRAEAVARGFDAGLGKSCWYQEDLRIDTRSHIDQGRIATLLDQSSTHQKAPKQLAEQDIDVLRSVIYPNWQYAIVQPNEKFERNFLLFDDIARFRDRVAYVAAIEQLWQNPLCRFVCVEGIPGIGKTALLAKTVERLTGDEEALEDCPLGVEYIDCSEVGASSFEGIWSRLLRLLSPIAEADIMRMYRAGTPTVRDRATEYLRHLNNEKALVILDSFEHCLRDDRTLTDPELAEFLYVFFKTSSSLKFIVASTKIPDFADICTGGLGVVSLDKGLPEADASDLLIDLDLNGEMGLRDADRNELTRIANRCFGIPRLLIEVASCLSLNRRSSTPIGRAGLPFVDPLPLQEKFMMLAPDERHVVDVLACLNEPATVELISAALGDEPPPDLNKTLDRLVDARVIKLRNPNQTYELTSLDKDYLISKAPQPTVLETRGRQATYYLSEAETLMVNSAPTDPISTGTVRLVYCGKAKTLADAIGDDQLGAVARYCEAETRVMLQQFALAVQCAEEARARAVLSKDTALLAKSGALLASIEWSGNRYYADFKLTSRALRDASRTGNRELQWDICGKVATLALRKRNWDILSRLQPKWEELGRQRGASAMRIIHQISGEAAFLRGAYSDALNSLGQALALSRERTNRVGECAALGWIGLCMLQVDFSSSEGLRLLTEALSIERHELQSREGVAKWLHYYGLVCASHRRWPDALSSLSLCTSLKTALELGDLDETRHLVTKVRRLAGLSIYKKWEGSFDPRKTLFSKYAFVWTIGPLSKHPGNPIIVRDATPWRSYSTYNPSAWTDGERVSLFVRCEEQTPRGIVSKIGLCESRDGVSFKFDEEPILEPSEDYDRGGCEDPRVVMIDGRFIMTYTGYDGAVARLCLAISNDRRNWLKRGPIINDDQWDGFFPQTKHDAPRGWCKSGAILPRKMHGQYWMYFGDKFIWVASSPDLLNWTVINEPALKPRKGYFDSYLVEPGPVPIMTSEGIWLGYNSADESINYAFGEALFDINSPGRLIARCEQPLLSPDSRDERIGQVDNVVFGEGLIRFRGKWHLYYGMADSRTGVATTDVVPGWEVTERG